jgi:two-component system response regulator MtrA
MSTQVLFVEDDAVVRDIASLVFERAGLNVTAVEDGIAASLEAAHRGRYDLMVLDLMLPGKSGLDVCREVRRVSNLPIVILTARADTKDVVRGLELGADDYVTKPFDPAELVARVRAVLRRARPEEAGVDRVEVRDIVLDPQAFRATRGDVELSLTSTEFRLLFEFLRHPGVVLERAALLSRVWGYNYLGDSRLVDMAIKRLRDKLGAEPEAPPYISTVRGVGYRFEVG